MREGQEAQRRLDPEAESWSMPSYALFALQRQGWVSHPVCNHLHESPKSEDAKQNIISVSCMHACMTACTKCILFWRIESAQAAR